MNVEQMENPDAEHRQVESKRQGKHYQRQEQGQLIKTYVFSHKETTKIKSCRPNQKRNNGVYSGLQKH